MEGKAEQKVEDVPIVVSLSTGLALKRTKPHRVPQRYLDGAIKEVLSYVVRTIEQSGDSDETMLAANIQDQMASRQYVIKMNGQNVNPDSNFGKLVHAYTQIEDTGDGEENMMKYREVTLVVTKVEEGGKVNNNLVEVM